MIKFFRKIRQNSIKKNKFTNYLKYAVGEIILVVLGILIALQINNWNENSKQQSKTKHLIERLQNQTKMNIQHAEYNIKNSKRVNKEITSLLLMIGKSFDKIQNGKVDSLLTKLTVDYHLGLNLNTLIEARDNGEISLIKSNDLKSKLYQLISITELVKKREEIANNDNNNFLVPFLYKNTNRRNISSKAFDSRMNIIGLSNLEEDKYAILLQNREFENLVNSRFNYSEAMIDVYVNVEKFLNDLNKQLEKESD